MPVNGRRIQEIMQQLGRIGFTEGEGVTRLPFTEEYEEAACCLKGLLQAVGLEVHQDPVGNIYGRRAGFCHQRPAILFGSHLDTVKNGGLFDGMLGIAAGLECMHVLQEENLMTDHPLALVAFNAEEGSELGGTFGSRAAMGLLEYEEEGLPQRLAIYGLTISDVQESILEAGEYLAYLELHISQEMELERLNIPIGIVNGIAGITRYQVTVRGEANHAGTTPMYLRRDALTGAAKLLLHIHRIAEEIGAPFVSTVGTLKVFPGSVNVIPGRVEFVLELRDLHGEKIQRAVEQIKEAAQSITDIQFHFQRQVQKPPVTTAKDIIQIIRQVCSEKGIGHQVMTSGAGHDAMPVAMKIPSGVIFVPSQKGKSHCLEEWTQWSHVQLGTQVLLDTILMIDKKLKKKG